MRGVWPCRELISIVWWGICKSCLCWRIGSECSFIRTGSRCAFCPTLLVGVLSLSVLFTFPVILTSSWWYLFSSLIFSVFFFCPCCCRYGCFHYVYFEVSGVWLQDFVISLDFYTFIREFVREFVLFVCEWVFKFCMSLLFLLHVEIDEHSKAIEKGQLKAKSVLPSKPVCPQPRGILRWLRRLPYSRLRRFTLYMQDIDLQ